MPRLTFTSLATRRSLLTATALAAAATLPMGLQAQSAADLARSMGAIPYEVLVQLSPAIERRLIE